MTVTDPCRWCLPGKRPISVCIALCLSIPWACAETGPSVLPTLSLPVACVPGQTCFIQSYVDIDPSPEIRDYACGTAAQEGHNGTDFRLLSSTVAEQGVSVLAAAGGRVKAVRDGMADVLVHGRQDARIKDRECGNGVVVDHGRGWETQYCHLRRGSLAVRRGEAIQRGQRLGEVGFSGLAQFAHVHFEVRHNGRVVDPFTGRGQEALCAADGTSAGGLWDARVRDAFPYANGEIIASGFVASVPSLEHLEREGTLLPPDRSSEQLIFVVRFINLRHGDRVRLTVTGPSGFVVDTTSDPLGRNKATYVAYAGKRRRLPRWAAGSYAGQVQLLRGAVVVAEEGTILPLDN